MARLGIDLDGVVYDFTADYRNWLINEHGRSADELPDPTAWHFFSEWGYTSKEFREQCDAATDAGFMFVVGEPLPGAIEAMRRLRDAGHELHIVTARNFGTLSHSNTEEWLKKWDVPYDSLTFSEDKTCVAVDAFIDDKIENVDALLEAGVDAWLLEVFGKNDSSNHPRLIKSWEEFEQKVAEHERLIIHGG